MEGRTDGQVLATLLPHERVTFANSELWKRGSLLDPGIAPNFVKDSIPAFPYIVKLNEYGHGLKCGQTLNEAVSGRISRPACF